MEIGRLGGKFTSTLISPGQTFRGLMCIASVSDVRMEGAGVRVEGLVFGV